MTGRLSSRVLALQPSATLAMDARAKAMIAAGEDVVNLGAGEPDFPTPEPIREAAIAAIRAGFTRYTAVGGIPELKKAIAMVFERDQGLRYDPDKEILVSVGAKHSLFNLFLAVLDPGDEVVLPAPYWVSYPEMVGLAGARAVLVESTAANGFVPDPKDVERACTDRTRLIVINSPMNPTGAAYPRAFMEEMVRLAEARDLMIVSDEIYRDIVYDGFRPVSPAEISPEGRARTIVVNGVSKTYAMTGWRIGYVAAPPSIVAAMGKLQGQSTSNPSSISQKAAIAALEAPRELVRGMVDEFAARMDLVVNGLNAIPGVRCPRPKGAFYVFPDVSAHFGKKTPGGKAIDGSMALTEYLLEHAKVAAVPGGPFGAEAHLRISFANSRANLEKAIARIGEALGKLRA